MSDNLDDRPMTMPRTPREKDPHAMALGHKGGSARARKLTPERRREIARRAAEARWRKAS